MLQLKMYRPDVPLKDFPMPEGYSLRPAVQQDGEDWCKCCVNGDLGVDKVDQAIFEEMMLGDKLVSLERILMAVNEAGEVAGTATARYSDDPQIGVIHMVGCSEGHKGKGLAKPMCNAVLQLLRDNGKKCCSLLTDDWRIPAIKTYLALDFIPVLLDEGMEGRWLEIMKQLKLAVLPTLLEKEGTVVEGPVLKI